MTRERHEGDCPECAMGLGVFLGAVSLWVPRERRYARTLYHKRSEEDNGAHGAEFQKENYVEDLTGKMHPVRGGHLGFVLILTHGVRGGLPR